MSKKTDVKTAGADVQADDGSALLGDLQAYLDKAMPGLKVAEFEIVGGLRPILFAEENQGKPFLAKIIAQLRMPDRKKKVAKPGDEVWSSILVELISPAICKVGEDLQEIPPGKEVFIPVSGSIGNNADLVNAAADPKLLHIGIFTVVGQRDTGKVTPMWEYEVRLHPKPIERIGKFARYNKPATAQLQQPTYTGEVLGADGRPVGSLLGTHSPASSPQVAEA